MKSSIYKGWNMKTMLLLLLLLPLCFAAPGEHKVDTKADNVGMNSRAHKQDYHTRDHHVHGCNIETGVYIAAGNNVKEMSTSGQEECSSACASIDDCVAWTMRTSDSYCWLKSDDSSKGNGEGWITGTKECGIKEGGRDLEFTTIGKGYYSGVRGSKGPGGDRGRVYKAFSSTPTWATFWASHSPLPTPLIDFDRNLVLAAFRGTHSSGGYGVVITNVRETRDALVVHVETRDPDPNSFTSKSDTQPFHLVQCERPGEYKPVKFVVEQWVPPPPAMYTFQVLFERDEDAADVLNKDVKSLNFVISVRLDHFFKIGSVTVDAALVEGPDAAKALLEQVAGIKVVERG